LYGEFSIGEVGPGKYTPKDVPGQLGVMSVTSAGRRLVERVSQPAGIRYAEMFWDQESGA